MIIRLQAVLVLKRNFYYAIAGLLFPVLILIAAPGAQAAIIAEWDLSGSNGATIPASTTDANVSAGDISASAQLNVLTGYTGVYASDGWGTGTTPDWGAYYQWTVTPDVDYEITYESISYALFRGEWGGGDHGAQEWSLYASTDGFATAGLFLDYQDISSSGADVQVLFAGVDISALGTVAGSVDFRLYGYDYNSTIDYSGIGNDLTNTWVGGTGTNLIVEGTVKAVPEPSTCILLITGSALCMAFFARQNRGLSLG